MSKGICILSKYFTKNDFMKHLDKNKFKYISKKNIFDKKKVYYIYFDRGTGYLNKIEKNKLWNIETNNLSALKLNNPNFTDKSNLNEYIKKKDNKLYKKYFMKQFDINNINKLKDNCLYITKPIPGFAGLGVKVFNNKNKIIKYTNTFKNPKNKEYMKTPERWIVEEYIKNPLLINNKKFHIRVTLLCLCNKGINRIYIHKHSLIFPAKHKYNIKNLNMNIHNTHGTLTESSEKKLFPRDFITLFGKEKTKKIKNDIKKLLKGLLNNNTFNFDCFKNSKNCFEFYGIDIMITDTFKIKCLEINEKPGLKNFLKHMPNLIKGLTDLTIHNKKKGIDYIRIK